MADRIHPAAASPPPSPPPPPLETPLPPPPGTIVIHLPKDQIFRIPSPENARLFEEYTRRATQPHRRPCATCLLYSAAALLVTILLLAALAGALYLALRPRLPIYTVTHLSNTSATFLSDNNNAHIALKYRHGGSVAVSYAGVTVGNGAWPEFRQARRNATAVVTALATAAGGVRWGGGVQRALAVAQRRHAVPLVVDVRVPVRVEFGGGLSSWTVYVKVRCEVTVNKLTAGARIVSKKKCKTRLHL